MSNKLFKILAILIIASFAFAGTTGKISGLVTDKASGEALPGVNVFLEGTTIGTSSDVDGFYVVLNVPVGTHKLKVSYVGYRDVTISQVVVSVDLTTELNIEMQEAVGEGAVVEIIAKRKLVRKDETNNTVIKSGEDIKNLPVSDIQSVVAVQAGVAKNDNSSSVYMRGGRSNETAFIVDGVNQNNILDGSVIQRVSKNAIEQIQVQSGGFSAEYGEVMSGLVHVTQKSGSELYEGGFEAYSDDMTSGDALGTHGYGHNNINGYLSGPFIPGNKDFLFFANVDFTKKDDRAPTYAINGIGAKPGNDQQIFTANFKTKVLISNNTVLKLGANLTKEEHGNYSLGNHYNVDNQLYSFNDAKSLTSELTHTFSKSFFVVAKASKSWNENKTGNRRLMDDLKHYGDPVFNNYAQNAFANSNQGIDTVDVSNGSGNPYRIFPNFNADVNPMNGKKTYSPANQYSRSSNEKLNASMDMNYQMAKHLIKAGFTYTTNVVRSYFIQPRSMAADGFKNDFPSFRNQASVRYYGYSMTGQVSDDDNWSYFNDISKLDGKTFGDGAKKPWIFGVYFNDKIELNDFVLSLGVRYDAFNANTWAFKDITKAYADGALLANDVTDSKTFDNFSPRIGISFPVDETSKFTANFGTFYQFPDLETLYLSRAYATQRFEESGFSRVLENPNLKPSRTTQYEVSYQKELTDDISVKVNAFYKETADLINERLMNVENKANANVQQLAVYDNMDFGFIKGLEIAVNTRRINGFLMNGSVTLQSATGTGSTNRGNSRISWLGGDLPRSVNSLDFDQPFTGNINVDYRFGKDEGPAIFGMKPLSNIGINVLTSFNAGRPFTKYSDDVYSPFTANTTIPVESVVNGVRSPIRFLADLRLDKSFQLFDTEMNFNVYVDVKNVFNIKNELYVYPSSGSAESSGWLATNTGQNWLRGQIKSNNGRVLKYPIKQASYNDAIKFAEADPTGFGSPRQILAGIRFDF